MPDTFPDIKPDVDSTKEVKFRVLVADFGDGYSQTTGDGINRKEEIWTLSFKDRSREDIATITDFLDTQESRLSFFWTPPELNAIEEKWKQQEEYTVDFPGGLLASLQVKFKRVYY